MKTLAIIWTVTVISILLFDLIKTDWNEISNFEEKDNGSTKRKYKR